MMLQFLKDADDGGNFSANNEDKEASMRVTGCDPVPPNGTPKCRIYV